MATSIPANFFSTGLKAINNNNKNKINEENKKGTYICTNCKSTLFSTNDQIDSLELKATQEILPIFSQPIEKENFKIIDTYSLGIQRKEIYYQCGQYLGTLLDGKYCIEPVNLEFVPEATITQFAERELILTTAAETTTQKNENRIPEIEFEYAPIIDKNPYKTYLTFLAINIIPLAINYIIDLKHK
eukprot:TRINITY_DN1_c1_g1_i1.p1 TRINITY_DN1_c1_g1~~TRINITY_DN1_c1_g1_i1.p1  ORF type:complete len:218 (-),score=84.72 TRINITY_DN1_c1_g1_i1:67-627(-)